jgi:predicted transcriptional regulator
VKTNLALNVGPRPGYGPLPTAQVNRRRSHLSSARAGILDVLIDQPEPCTVASLAALIGQHPNTIREHLDSLSDGGLVVRTRAEALGRGRPAWLYSASPEVGSNENAREYASLASALAAQIGRSSPQPDADAIAAGRIWGQELARLSQVKDAEIAAAAGTSENAGDEQETAHSAPSAPTSAARWSSCLTASGLPPARMPGSASSSCVAAPCSRQPIGIRRWCAQSISASREVPSTSWATTLNEAKRLRCNHFRSPEPAAWTCSPVLQPPNSPLVDYPMTTR